MRVRVNRVKNGATGHATSRFIKPLSRGHFPIVKDWCVDTATQHKRHRSLLCHLIDEVTQQGSMSFVLSSSVDAPVFNDREVAAAQWLNETRGSVAGGPILNSIYADAHRRALFDRFDLYHPANYFLQPRETPRNSYVYLGTFNVERDKIAKIATTTLLGGTVINYADLHRGTEGFSKIFDDGGATIYYQFPT